MVDKNRPATRGTEYLCPALQLRLASSVLAVATDGWDHLAGAEPPSSDHPFHSLCRRVAAGIDCYIFNQPLRPIRPAAGLSVPTGKRVHVLEVRDSGAVQIRPPSALCGLVVRILGDTDDDGSTSGFCAAHDRLYPACHSVGGAGFACRPRRGICRIPPAGSHVATSALRQEGSGTTSRREGCHDR